MFRCLLRREKKKKNNADGRFFACRRHHGLTRNIAFVITLGWGYPFPPLVFLLCALFDVGVDDLFCLLAQYTVEHTFTPVD
jgi:hypothetical protein